MRGVRSNGEIAPVSGTPDGSSLAGRVMDLQEGVLDQRMSQQGAS